MTDDQAQTWLSDRCDVSRETIDRMAAFVNFLREEAINQNLIAASTLGAIWSRHIADSAQLVPLSSPGRWIDLGSGAGFPGLVVAALRNEWTTLVEARRRRAEFLTKAVAILGISDRTTIAAGRAEALEPATFATISARAFAPLERLLAIGQRFAGPDTRWILPKGRNAQAELDTARRTWQGDFRIQPSITDPDSAIIVAERVRPRKQR